MISITMVILLIGVVVGVYVYKKRKQGEMGEPNYRALFVIGFCFLPIGIILMTIQGSAFMGFTAIGLIFIIIGAANRDKWEKKK